MFRILYKEMHGIFPESITPADYGVLFPDIIGYLPPVLEFPGHHIGGRIVFHVTDLPPYFQDQGLKTLFRKLFAAPAAPQAGPTADGAKQFVLNEVSHTFT